MHVDEYWTIISDNQESSDCRETWVIQPGFVGQFGVMTCSWRKVNDMNEVVT